MNRWFRTAVIPLALTVVLVTPVSASQLFPFGSGVNKYNYQGVMSEVSAQDPFMDGLANWSASPVAITMWDEYGPAGKVPFLEAGNEKLKANNNWTRRPY